jgi:NADH-quinone oxidoreductase subunit D
LLDNDHAIAVARFLRDDESLDFDYASNVSGVDWPERTVKSTRKVSKIVSGVAKDVDEVVEQKTAPYLEAVYHLYSVRRKCGPLILRLRTGDRSAQVELPSLTHVWRSCEFQEREIFDLYGIVFNGHPDLRRLLMWSEFSAHPMRKDYAPVDDDESAASIAVTEPIFAPVPAGAETLEKDASAQSARIDFGPMVPEKSTNNLGEGLLEVAMGPQHPSTHGVFRMDVTLDGEQVIKLKPVFGYLHRNHEKLGEKNSYLGNMPYTDRLDYLCAMTNNWAYANAVEKLTGLQPPPRAEYIRVIVAELTRLLNHSCLAGFLLQDMGAMGTPLMYAFREREKILDLFESLTGSRMMHNYMRFGGCRCDLPEGWRERAIKLVNEFPRFLDEFEELLTGNDILLVRTQNIGAIKPEAALNAGLTGPILRATGVNYDLRKVDAYGAYPQFSFRVPLGQRGDTFDRYMIRILEMRESVKLLQQALATLPDGPVIDPKSKLRNLRPKPGEVYGRIESPKGELGFYLISDGGACPYRYRIRPPSLINLTLLEDMCLGHTIADVVVILGSIDIVLGEVDR